MVPVARSVYERVAVYVRSPFGMLGGSQVTVREEEFVITSIRLVTGLGTGGGRVSKSSYAINLKRQLEKPKSCLVLVDLRTPLERDIKS